MIYSACACGGNTSVRGLEVYRCGYILGSGIRDGLVSARARVCMVGWLVGWLGAIMRFNS